NRAAQRTFRNRRKAYIKDMEQRVVELDTTREQMQAVRTENQEIWRRYRVLEQLVVQSGLSLPVFEELAPVKEEDPQQGGGSGGVVLTGTAGSGQPHGHVGSSGVIVDHLDNQSSEIDGEGEEDEEAVLAMAPHPHHPHQQHHHSSIPHPLRQGMASGASSSLKRRNEESEGEYQDD
ncbi:hypothetical protein BGZ92_007099, partial [Podila epicladia]